MPLVTVVTPSYNHARFIRTTIESVLTQDYPNVEYIVMDALSKDSTSAICAEYADRLRFISERDRGQSDAINKGFARARGSIVAWLNSDDVFLPGAISSAVEAFRREPDAGAVYGEGYQIDVEGNIKQRFAVTEPFNLWKLVYLSDYILQQTVFFRKAALDTIGPIEEGLHYVMDWDLLIRLGKRFMLRYIPVYMGSIREHEEAKTATGGARRFKEISKIMRRHGRPFSPGWIVYGLETYNAIWNEWVERSFRGPLAVVGRRLQSVFTRLAHKAIHRVIRECQGLYGDGWAAKRLHYMLPPGRGRYLEVAVFLPEGLFERQTLALRIDGRTIESQSFSPGEFVLPFRIPERYWDRTLEFSLVAKRTYRAPKRAVGWDTRRLAYLVRAIGYSERVAAAERRPARHEPSAMEKIRKFNVRGSLATRLFVLSTWIVNSLSPRVSKIGK